DPVYHGMDAADVSLTNADNDAPGITVTPTAGLVTTEAGGQASFTVVLNSQPTADVVIPVASSNPAAGTASAASLTFTAARCAVPPPVPVTVWDDKAAAGSIAYPVVLGAAPSADPVYQGMDAADVALSNADNDTAGITVAPTSGLATSEAGGQASFTVVLN